MTRKSIILCLTMMLATIIPVGAAGPMGHYLIGKQLISNIQNNRCKVDPELKYILKHPDAQRAFEGGCVGPDIAEEQSHYRDTARLAANMLKDARERYKLAASSKDEAAFAKARQDLAFAYGWYSHCASDLNIHPKVNEVVGDTFRFNSAGQKANHATQESQLTAYLKSVMGNSQYDVYIPYDFLSRHVGVSVEELKLSDKKLRTKLVGELSLASTVKMNDKIAQKWRAAVNGSLRESEMYLSNPSAMQNWDLDCGKISTAEFDQLRTLAIKANDGKLPEEWSKSYLTWFEKTRGLSAEKQLEVLKSLISKKPEAVAIKPPIGKVAVVPPISNTRPAWVLTQTKEYPFSDSTYTNTGAKGKYTLKWESRGCYAQGCPGEILEVQYSCSAPPATIKPGEKISLKISGKIANNTIQHYGCNTSMDVFFDRADIEPGSYGGGPGLGGIKIGGKDKAGPPETTVSGSPGRAYETSGTMALIVAMYNGRSAGTKYIYEWKK